MAESGDGPFLVIGSCITRDVWGILGEPLPDTFRFFARTSIPSLVSAKPTFQAEPTLDWDKPAPAGWVMADIEKTVLPTMLANPPRTLLVDMIDERFDLLEVNGALFTRSYELECGLIRKGWTQHYRRIPRLSDEAWDLWIRGLHEFANILSDRRFASTRIVLHWSQWATTYMDGAEVKPLPSTTHFYPGEGGEIVAHNELLTRYQMAFVDAFSRALVIHVGDRYRVADRNHRWGLAPYHFIDEYYREFLRCAAELGVR